MPDPDFSVNDVKMFVGKARPVTHSLFATLELFSNKCCNYTYLKYGFLLKTKKKLNLSVESNCQ